MIMKQKITIKVTDRNGKKATLLRGAEKKLPARLVRFLFGDYTQIYLLSPGQMVASVIVSESKEGEETHDE